jgi:hypothetical protein
MCTETELLQAFRDAGSVAFISMDSKPVARFSLAFGAHDFVVMVRIRPLQNDFLEVIELHRKL